MKTYSRLYQTLCSYQNLESAFQKARKRKTLKPYVIEFEAALKQNLLQLQFELLTFSYQPQSLKQFIIREPKTRKISKSAFRDRVVHHALVNILEPIFESIFIHDSYASRKGKGTLAALNRFDFFKRKVSGNGKKLKCIKDGNYIGGYCLKADIRHYFDTMDHEILIRIIQEKIKDKDIIWLVKKILDNHLSPIKNKGLPLGNHTSQFFANVYLNKLDYFVKHQLKARYYLRYVDDFVILHQSKEHLEKLKSEIDEFLNSKLKINLHPEKSKLIPLHQGINLLGFRVFYYHKLLRKANFRKMVSKLNSLQQEYQGDPSDYQRVYDFLEGWIAYAKHANTYKLRKGVLDCLEHKFSQKISAKK